MALVEVERRGAVALVTLRRDEKLNALSAELEQALGEALASDEVTGCRSLVVGGSDRAFSAGADLGELARADPGAVLAYYRDAGAVYERLARLPVPTVAAIRGYCLGGGFELALACDFRVVAEDAVLGLPEASLGILPSAGGVTRLVRAVGTARAKQLVLLGRRFPVADALAHGLATEVVPSGEVAGRALLLAEQLAALPPLAAAVNKEAIELAADASREAALMIERLAYAVLAGTADAAEAAAAAAEKREPRFRGA